MTVASTDAIAPVSRRQQVARAATITRVAARHGARLARVRRPARRERIGTELRHAFVELGPTYVKLAQLISSSPGLFPAAIADELRLLLDRVPPAPRDAILATIEADLGAAPEELFDWFDPAPLASASVAQVHAATLADGTQVVVKVQRPEIRVRLAADIQILRRVAHTAERASELARMASPVAIVDDFAQTLSDELNFVTEGRSMESWSANLAAGGAHEGVRTPSVHWPLTSARVLTMERVDGVRIDDLAGARSAGLDLQLALRHAARAFVATAFVHGFFHGDMHAGNLLVDRNNRVVFLDFGIMGRLERDKLALLRQTIPALFLQRDYRQLARAVYRLGAIQKPHALDSSAAELEAFVKPVLKKSLSEISYGSLLTEIASIGRRYGLRMPGELVLLAKQCLYCERYAKLIAPDWNLLGDPELLKVLLESEPATAAASG